MTIILYRVNNYIRFCFCYSTGDIKRNRKKLKSNKERFPFHQNCDVGTPSRFVLYRLGVYTIITYK